MSFQAMTWAIEQRLDAKEKLVLIVLANYAGHDGTCYPSHARLAGDCGLSIRTIQRAIASLEGLGLVSHLRRVEGKGETSCIYSVQMEANRSVTVTDPLGHCDVPPRSQCRTPSVTVTDEPVIEPVKEPVKEPIAKTKDYCFEGRLIKLRQRDFDKWSESFPNIPNLRGVLEGLDAYYAEQKPPIKDWFMRTAGALAKKDSDFAKQAAQEAAASKARESAWVGQGIG